MKRIASLFLVPLVAACAGDNTTFDDIDVREQAWEDSDSVGLVANGDDAMQCAWPTAVSTSIGCTGTLVHPQVVVTAAHCWPPGGTEHFNFGEVLDGQQVEVERCARHPDYMGPINVQVDYSYCILKEPVDLPITPFLPRSCYEEALQPGSRLMMAGFGLNEQSIDGIKRWSWTSIREFKWSLDMNRVLVGYGDDDSPGVSCPGDSGGPLFYQAPEGTWWNLGILSTIVGSCGGETAVNRYTLLEGAIEWIENDSGMDITPCSNNGQWDPGPECQNVYAAEPGQGHGNWGTNSWCEGTPAVAVPSRCGNGTGGTTGSGGADATGGTDGSGGAPSSGGTTSAGGTDATGGTETVDATGGVTTTTGGTGGVVMETPDEGPVGQPARSEETSGCQCQSSALGERGTGWRALLVLFSTTLFTMRRRRRQPG